MRARVRAFVIPFAAGISAAWTSRRLKVPSPPNAPFRLRARPPGEFGPMNCSIMAFTAGSTLGSSIVFRPPIIGDTRDS
jgi:hypothetical protein